MAKAIAGRVYAQILDGKVHWIFTAEDLPEWAEGSGEFEIQTIDITDTDPRPQTGWFYEAGVFSSGVTEKSVAELSVDKLRSINEAAARELDALTASYPAGEVSSWPQQTSEANTLLAALEQKGVLLEGEEQALAPLLYAVATARGIPVAELASRVLAKVQQFAIVSGQIIGKRQVLEDAIAAVDLQADDAIAQLEAIAW